MIKYVAGLVLGIALGVLAAIDNANALERGESSADSTDGAEEEPAVPKLRLTG